jgi:hypothetical protein
MDFLSAGQDCLALPVFPGCSPATISLQIVKYDDRECEKRQQP